MTLKERLDVYEQLMRLDKPIGILLLLWPTLWGLWVSSYGQPDPAVLIIFVVGVILMRSAGCIVNDIADRDFDPQVERTKDRPLARGAISVAEAIALAVVLALIAFVLVLFLNALVVQLAVIALALAIIYPFLKRFFWLPQAWLGIAFGFGIPMAFAAHHDRVPPIAWWLLAANVFWTIAYDTEYAMVDREDDRKLGLKTSAMLFGRFDVVMTMLCLAIFIALMVVIGVRARLGVGYFSGIGVAALFAGYQYVLIRDRTREGCFKAFHLNNWVGAAVFAGFVADFLLRIPRTLGEALMVYRDLRDFLGQLEAAGALKRVATEVDPRLEITEICDRVLKSEGPALLFERPKGYTIPLLANLFGTTARVARGMGRESIAELRELGELLAYLKEPDPPRGLRDAWEKLPLLKRIISMAPKTITRAPCQAVVVEASDVDLARLPIQTCWPGDAGPLITWGLVITRGPQRTRQNLGIYRMQVIERNRVIMRWLAHRGGALDFRDHSLAHPGTPFPVAVALGADPATMLGAVTPVPDALSEYQFAGLLRGARTELANCLGSTLQVPAHAEIVLEGAIHPNDSALEGPFGDHTGYYNEQERFPVFTIERMTMRPDPIYHSTYTGKPPDEPAVLGVALNEVFVPLLRKQFPEIVDFYLPPEGCSYRLSVVSMRKQYPGHAKRVMFGIWSFLRQFMYTKFIIVTDDDVNIRDWKEVIWALTTRVDPKRDTFIAEHTPIDYLDFASPVAGLGSKMGIDATNKWPGESDRRWGTPITMDDEVKRRVDALWSELGL